MIIKRVPGKNEFHSTLLLVEQFEELFSNMSVNWLYSALYNAGNTRLAPFFKKFEQVSEEFRTLKYFAVGYFEF
jgi:hypothetical protein